MFLSNLFKKNTDQPKKRQLTILVIDDNPVDRKLLTQTLKKYEYRVITAKDGVDGYLSAKKHLPDLILSDCNMPEMTGTEMFNMIRQEETTNRIPFVFLTAMDSPAHLVDCFDKGATDYFCKPINAQTIANQIEEILEDNLTESQEIINDY